MAHSTLHLVRWNSALRLQQALYSLTQRAERAYSNVLGTCCDTGNNFLRPCSRAAAAAVKEAPSARCSARSYCMASPFETPFTTLSGHPGVPAPATSVSVATGAVLGGQLGCTFNKALYPTLYEQHSEDRGVNGPIFARGACGGGNANAGHFRRTNMQRRPESAPHQRSHPRLDNLGNISHLAPKAVRTPRQYNPFAQGPDFSARTVTPGTVRSSSYSHISSGASQYSRSQNMMGDFGAVSRAKTPFGTWKEAAASLSRDASPSRSASPERGTMTARSLGSSRSGSRSPHHFYADAGCKVPTGPMNKNKIFNPLADR